MQIRKPYSYSARREKINVNRQKAVIIVLREILTESQAAAVLKLILDREIPHVRLEQV